MVAQVYAEASLSPALADVVARQVSAMRARVVDLMPDDSDGDAEQIAEAFVAICGAYNQQLALRGDVDPAPFVRALAATLRG